MKLKKILTYISFPILFGIAGCFFLCLVSLIPDSAVYDNALISAQQLSGLGIYDVILDENDPSCTIDSSTDRQIIMESYTLSNKREYSFLLNPRCWIESDDNVSLFTDLLEGRAECNQNYLRYWMGFRILYRPLLVFTPYFGMLKLVGFLLCLSYAAAIAVVGEKAGIFPAIGLGVAVGLMNPGTIVHSLQFSICFLMAAVFIILAVSLSVPRDKMPLLFCLFGIITQFMDFYTTPLLTFGFPILTVMCLKEYSGKRLSTLLKTFGAWLYGYVSMWLVKLALVTGITGQQGFEDGFLSLAGRIGLIKVEGFEKYYDIKKALESVWWICCPGDNEKLVFLLIAALVICSGVMIFVRKGADALLDDLSFLAAAIMPVIWFICAAQPTLIHFWFQYRSIAVFFAGVLLFLAEGIRCITPGKQPVVASGYPPLSL